MLTISRSHNAHAATEYFVNGLSSEGYYLDDNVKATWRGFTAKLLSLSGKKVTKSNFSNLVANIHPKTKERLTVRNVQNRRAGFDLTFSAVKSVSVLYALTNDPKILKAHQKAYQKAMLAVQEDAQTQANYKNKRIYQNTGNIIYGAFDHFTTRPNEIIEDGVKKYVSDPQLHTHCYVPNVTWNAKKNRFQALEIGNIHRLANYYESIYHSHLAKTLNEIGYQVERTGSRYEIVGISRKIIEKFSNRTAIIEKLAKEKGIIDPKAKAKLGVLTRNSKNKVIEEEKLTAYWKKRITAQELKAIQSLQNNIIKPIPSITAKEAIDRAISHFEERQSAYQQKRVLAYALSLAYGELLLDDVKKELSSRTNILSSKIDSVDYITTHEMVKAEEKMIGLASLGKGTQNPIHQNYKIKQDFLNENQKQAIQKLLNSFDKVNLLKGAAGVGKTSLLTEVRFAVKESKKSLIALAPSSQAVKQLEKKGFDSETIAGFLVNFKKQELLQNNVLLVDEAGMVGVKTMSKLLELSHLKNAKIILSGDTKQHNAVEFGDALRILEEKANIKTAEVTKIVRQKPNDYKKAVEFLAKGDTAKGFQALDKMNAIQEIPDHDTRIETMTDDYIKSIKQNKTALMISPTHYEGDILNNVVRQKLKSERIISGKDKEFKTLRNLSFTESQKKDLKQYQEGQVLRFINHQKGGYKAGEHYEVMPPAPDNNLQIKEITSGKVFPLPHQNSDNFHVYEKRKTLLAKGDSIRLTQNTKSLENTKMNNGTVYQIEGFTKSGDLKLSNQKTLSKDNGHFKHAYCETSYSSQGKDAKNVFISMSDLSFGGVSKEQFYVSVSRGTQSATIYTSDKVALQKAIQKSNQRITAQEIQKNNTHDRFIIERQQKADFHKLQQKLPIKEHKKEKDIDLNREF